mgnify:CR=1 FL=1
MPKIIKNTTIVDDAWQVLGQDEPLPAMGDCFIPLARWRDDARVAEYTGGQKGLWLAADADITDVAPYLEQAAKVAIDFPAFTDGRGYSLARLLRERYAYQGEIRAVGDVLRDQLFFMARCGFDAFAVRADKNIEDALLGLGDFSEAYQVSVERQQPLFKRRA